MRGTIGRGRQSIHYSKEMGFMLALWLAGPEKSVGFTIKRKSQMLFSERNGYRRQGVKIGPWYVNGLRNRHKPGPNHDFHNQEKGV